MSILVEIAGRADVSVEGVVRVLTREPVSAAVKERVLAVLDQLDADQTRILERFALVSVHDVVPLAEGYADEPPPDETGTPEPSVHKGQLELGQTSGPEDRSSERVIENAELDERPEAELPARLGALLEELVTGIRELRQERRSDRQERLDDLAVLVDLMTTSWQGVDRRLGRLEQLVARREASWHTTAPAGAQHEPPSLQPVPDAVPSPPADTPSRSKRSWPPFAGTLLLVGCLIGALLAFDLLPSRADGPRFVSAPEKGADTTLPAATTTAATTGGLGTSTSAIQTQTQALAQTQTGSSSSSTQPRPAPQRPAPPVSSTRPRTTPPSTQPSARRQTTAQAPAAPAPPPAERAPATTAPATLDGGPGEFIWVPVEDATYYVVEFFRDGRRFHQARPTEPRLDLSAVAFPPGAYRWLVSPGFGAPSENRLGAPVVDSSFSVGP